MDDRFRIRKEEGTGRGWRKEQEKDVQDKDGGWNRIRMDEVLR